ncbi:potassium channel subfamily K member 15-like [Actinia tenebrosa]|uniref:Potassium channel subfamily K member 15-like n=1 Tax=Actinia tenebrosa TaxID=6105 RepID=A0A6P8HB29_ACTTE|nr:potassium channel subfamily K member 15-like [Actinia tenebrosa]
MNPIYKKCLFRMFLFFGYGLIGSWLFNLIEEREEAYADIANRLLDELKEEMKNKYKMTNSTDFDKFVEKANKASQLMSKMDWTFLNGCGFTFAAITTIGYGDISPRTPLGQGLSIPFCLVGITITMLAFKTAGEVVLIGLKTITVLFEKKILRREYAKRKLLKCLFVIIFWMTFLICLLAMAETYIDGWTFLEGFYCWFITFTTIGFGDYIPFRDYRLEKKGESKWILVATGLVFTIPFVTGLCLVSSFLNLLVDSSDKIKVHFHKVTSFAVCSSNCSNTNEASLSSKEVSSNDINLKPISCRRCSV